MTGFLPYGRQIVEDDDIEAVVAALRADYLTTGPLVERFEAALCRVTGAAHAVACANGTAALHLAALALELAPGQAAIVPSLTFLATANAVRMTGAEVVFADVDPDTGLMTPDSLAQAIKRVPAGLQLRAAFPVHLNGQAADMSGLAEIASAHRLALVEDACHAIGGTDAGGNLIGSCRYSDMACFSFHPVKTITTGEGGAVTTGDAKLALRLRQLRNHGMTRDAEQFALAELAYDASGMVNPWYYEMPVLGYNYRLPDINCALGLSQLNKLERFRSIRQRLVAAYDAEFSGYAPRLGPLRRRGGNPLWHLYVLLIDFAAIGMTRADFMQSLRGQGIGTQVHYIPVHLQPYYRNRYGVMELPGAMAYYQRCLSLPLHAGMTDVDCRRVARAVKTLLNL
jgi:UDP-4-amino-4,6-dideoxy-N-acetyl-beta-L-altrosamine transaminase